MGAVSGTDFLCTLFTTFEGQRELAEQRKCNSILVFSIWKISHASKAVVCTTLPASYTEGREQNKSKDHDPC